MSLATAMFIVAGAAAMTAALIVLLRPLLIRYAMARPNARSSHTTPTPQGAGIAVVAAIAALAIAAGYIDAGLTVPSWLPVLLGVAAILALMGTLDDVKPLPVLPRLAIQLAAAVALVALLPADARILALVPWPLERMLLVIGLVWFINLVNFMDGIDWMTVAEVVPVSATLAILASTGLVPALSPAAPVALALAGAMLGFAPFNRHVARFFLGDVGSLPIGAIMGFLLILLAAGGHLAAALILPLYYLMDATITLIRRWRRGERLSQAHRSHFYQHAIQRGFSAPEVTNWVIGLNGLLAALAIVTVMRPSIVIDALALTLAVCATAFVLIRFEKGRT